MAKVQIKNEKITPFGGIYFVTKQFKPIERAIDEYLGRRCVSVGYQYGEIVRAMMCNFSAAATALHKNKKNVFLCLDYEAGAWSECVNLESICEISARQGAERVRNVCGHEVLHLSKWDPASVADPTYASLNVGLKKSYAVGVLPCLMVACRVALSWWLRGGQLGAGVEV